MRSARLLGAFLLALVSVSGPLARANVIVVDTPADAPDPLPGKCELRQAILAANGNTQVAGCGPGSGIDSIVFALGAGNPEIDVTPLIPLPAITEPVAIDGATGGATRVVLHGPGSAAATNGLTVSSSAPGTAIRNLVIDAFDGNGLEIEADGVSVTGCSISHNQNSGILVAGSGALIQGNVIGPSNGAGIVVQDTTYAAIGGSAPGARNRIAGNSADGILLDRSINASVFGNYIGTSADGQLPDPNGGSGVRITSDSGSRAIGNVIGGPLPERANVIAFNQGDGVQVAGANSLGNDIELNSIHDNAGKGIHNVSGGNGELAPPVIFQAGANISGSVACGPCSVDVYADAEDEGRSYLGSVASAGNWVLDVPATGPHITATATEFFTGNTSEFSAPFSCTDRDGDGVCDAADDCPFYANPTQSDADGNNRGDACECGDQDGNGRVNVLDLIAINLAIFDPAAAAPLCDANGDGLCNVADIVAANRTIYVPKSSTCSRQPAAGP